MLNLYIQLEIIRLSKKVDIDTSEPEELTRLLNSYFNRNYLVFDIISALNNMTINSDTNLPDIQEIPDDYEIVNSNNKFINNNVYENIEKV